MTTTFTGQVRIPGSIENGLPSTITLDAQTLVLTAGGTELGRWNRNDLKLRREPDGSFHLTLGREVVLFNPDSPLEFAILSGMPGSGTAPAPAPAPPPAEAAPAPAQPVVPVPPAATPPPTPAPTQAPAAPVPAAPVPAVPQPSPSAPAPAAPQASPSTPPPATPEPAVPPPAAQPVAMTSAPPTDPAPPAPDPSPPAAAPHGASPLPATAPPAPAAPPQPPAARAPVEFQLEERFDVGATPEAPPSPPGPGSSAGASTDFWDGFYAEEHEASAMPITPAADAAQEEIAGEEVEPAPGFQLTDDLDDTAAEPQVGGFGSGLFSEEDDRPAHPPVFGDDTGISEERDWSDNDEEDEGTDRGWSYGDDVAKEETEKPPTFRSPDADREDLVGSSPGSRFAAIKSWRPSLPSLSFGPSSLGMRARGALSLLDAILEENDTEDISRTLLIGLGGFAFLLGTVAVLVVLFG